MGHAACFAKMINPLMNHQIITKDRAKTMRKRVWLWLLSRRMRINVREKEINKLYSQN